MTNRNGRRDRPSANWEVRGVSSAPMRRMEVIVLAVFAAIGIPLIASMVLRNGVGMTLVSLAFIGAGTTVGILWRRRLDRR